MKALPFLRPNNKLLTLVHHSRRQLGVYAYHNDAKSSSLATKPFQQLVQTLKSTQATCTIIESSAGGLISSSLMSVPGSSRVYFGGTVAYSTKRAGKLLCGDVELHDRLLKSTSSSTTEDDNKIVDVPEHLSDETKAYIQSKVNWTREAALAYCKHMNVDFAIAEGGATGPTFNPVGMKAGFAVLAIAGRRNGQDDVEILAQKAVYSTHGDRELNMRLYADAAAKLTIEAMKIANPSLVATMTEEEVQSKESDNLYLDRSSHLRNDKEVMQELYNRPDAQHVIIRGTSEVMFTSDAQLHLPTLDHIHSDTSLEAMFESDSKKREALENRTFLGRLGDEQTPLFALFLPENTTSTNETTSSPYYFANTRSRAPMLSPLDNEIALTASAYVNWRNNHKYCSKCGSAVDYAQGGTCAKCTNGHMSWPRQDPSIIVLVTNSDSTHALLARSPRHPSYLYTALAGFVEPGENMESAVAREVHEEVGVNVNPKSINYISSQAWPFPQSCMIGFHAQTHHSADSLASISIDPKELVDARWFEKEEVYQAARDTDMMGAVLDRQVVETQKANGKWTGSLLVPSKGVLARTLVDSWLEK